MTMNASDAPPTTAARARAPKAVRDGYAPGPFFFAERRGDATRLVAWTSDVAQLRTLVDRVLDRFPRELRVVMAIRSDQSSGGWIRYDGECDLAIVRAAVAAHEECVLQDGESQLTIEAVETGQRLTIDDVGVLHLPAPSPDLEQACVAAGFARRKEELIGRGGGWRRAVAGDVRQQLIAALRLELARGGDEAPIDEERLRRRQSNLRFAAALWGTVGGVLVGLGTNDIVGASGGGPGVLAVVSVAAGAMLILASVRGGLAQIRATRAPKPSST
jgi:hypothetical protein